MSDFSAKTTADSKDADQSSSSDEGGSSRNAGRSFWARAARILRPQQGSRLREDLADALMTSDTGDDAFSPDERAMLHNILRFREVRVADVMVPRADIEAVDQTITIGELMILFEESGRSRMPVYADTLDDPRGMVHIRTFSPMSPSRRATSAGPASRQKPPNRSSRSRPKTSRRSAAHPSRISIWHGSICRRRLPRQASSARSCSSRRRCWRPTFCAACRSTVRRWRL